MTISGHLFASETKRLVLSYIRTRQITGHVPNSFILMRDRKGRPFSYYFHLASITLNFNYCIPITAAKHKPIVEPVRKLEIVQEFARNSQFLDIL